MDLNLGTAQTDVGSKPGKNEAGNAKCKGVTIQKRLIGGWTVEVQGRMAAVKLAERIQESDALLFVDEVRLRFGCRPSVITVKGDRRYEPELLEIIMNGGYY